MQHKIYIFIYIGHFFLPNRKERKRERERERAMMKLKMYINIRFEKEARPRYERAVDFLLSQFVITP